MGKVRAIRFLLLCFTNRCKDELTMLLFTPPASLVTSPQEGQRRSFLSKRHLSLLDSPISCKRYAASMLRPPSAGLGLSASVSFRACSPVQPGSPEELLQSLVSRLHHTSVQVEVNGDQALSAGLDLVRRTDFDPAHLLSIRSENKLTKKARIYPSLDVCFFIFVFSTTVHHLCSGSKMSRTLCSPAAMKTQPRSTS